MPVSKKNPRRVLASDSKKGITIYDLGLSGEFDLLLPNANLFLYGKLLHGKARRSSYVVYYVVFIVYSMRVHRHVFHAAVVYTSVNTGSLNRNKISYNLSFVLPFTHVATYVSIGHRRVPIRK